MFRGKSANGCTPEKNKYLSTCGLIENTELTHDEPVFQPTPIFVSLFFRQSGIRNFLPLLHDGRVTPNVHHGADSVLPTQRAVKPAREIMKRRILTFRVLGAI